MVCTVYNMLYILWIYIWIYIYIHELRDIIRSLHALIFTNFLQDRFLKFKEKIGKIGRS